VTYTSLVAFDRRTDLKNRVADCREKELKYDLFLFDADDTLYDFGKSEQKAFSKTLSNLGITGGIEEYYTTYKIESAKLWRQLELGETTKDFLLVERFRKTLGLHEIQVCPEAVNNAYLEVLSESVYLHDYALKILEFLHGLGEVGIITNGVEIVQKRKLQKSGLGSYVSFMTVSEKCGYAKPDIRFFEHTMTKAKSVSKKRTLVIGDRLETDIAGAHAFGVDSCWYNPKKSMNHDALEPKFQIDHLSQLEKIVIS